jgi:hypothetical protein
MMKNKLVRVSEPLAMNSNLFTTSDLYLLLSPSSSFFPMIVDYKRMSDLFDDNLQSMRAPSSVPYPSLSSLVRDDEEQIGPCFRASGYEFKPFYHF